MSFLKDLRKAESSTGLFVATILLVPVQTTLFIPLALDASLKIINSGEYSWVFSYNPFVFGLYVSIPIIYCGIVAHFFHPKRMVSPFNIQIIALVLFYAIEQYHAYSTMPLNPLNILLSLIIFVIYASVAITIGLIQYIIVRLVIGLDFDSTNIKQVTYSINADFKTVKEQVINSDFLLGWHFRRLNKSDRLIVYEAAWKNRLMDSTHLILAFVPHEYVENSVKKKETYLSLLVYRQTFNEITGAYDAAVKIDSFYRLLRGKLFDVNVRYDLTIVKNESTELQLLPMTFAGRAARSVPTIAKGSFKEIWRRSRYHVAVSIILIALVISLTVALWFKIGGIDSNAYWNAIIVIALVFATDVGLALRGETSGNNIT